MKSPICGHVNKHKGHAKSNCQQYCFLDSLGVGYLPSNSALSPGHFTDFFVPASGSLPFFLKKDANTREGGGPWYPGYI